MKHHWLPIAVVVVAAGVATSAFGQSVAFPWSGYGHDAQHACNSAVKSQPLHHILWQTPVDLDPQFTYGELLVHYGSPSITRANNIIVPVKTGASGGFQMESLVATNGATNWIAASDYILPPYSWMPSYSGTLTPQNRFYFPGGGGTVYYCDTPDTSGTPAIGQLAFYGLTNYFANTNAYLGSVFINTPVTSDRYGNIYFGFEVTGSTPLGLSSGLARIDANGNSTWIAAAAMVTNGTVSKVVMNCAPALSPDHKTLYVATVSCGNCGGGFGYGYLVALNSRTLAPVANVRLKDVLYPSDDANITDNGTAAPTVGPDGDVFYGVMEAALGSNHYRGWMLHYDGTLSQTKIAGDFGWDDSGSIVPASLVDSYCGSSPYLLMTKYNNYAEAGGDGVNKVAVLDPQNSMIDPDTGATVMLEVLTKAGPTPDPEFGSGFPNAVREWCINSAAVDLFTKSILVNNEDGNLYRWDLTSNALIQTVNLTAGIGEAYTPTMIGVNGIVYAINNSILFAVGQ